MPTTLVANHSPAVIPNIPPIGWRKEMPVYRVRAETRPALKSRFKFENPFAQIMDPSEWQYGEKVWPAGSVIETDQWPCVGTFVPLNYSAREILFYFNGHQKSRMQRTPWRDGQVCLEDGISGIMPTIKGPVTTAPRSDPPHTARERQRQARTEFPGL
jgi:hypothetical protein